MASERAQATIEWTAVVLLVALAFASLLALGLPHLDARSYGGALARAIVCAVRSGCDDELLGSRSAVGGGLKVPLLLRSGNPIHSPASGEAQVPDAGGPAPCSTVGAVLPPRSGRGLAERHVLGERSLMGARRSSWLLGASVGVVFDELCQQPVELSAVGG
jgi:hypothetical protein